jgi:1-acyl-sn-glycerol-3-phosphate acyltransferase
VIYPLVRCAVRGLAAVLFRISYHGREHLPDRGPLILAANHQSFLDPWLIGAGIRLRPRYLVYHVYMDMSLVGRVARFFGGLPVGKGAATRSLRAVRAALDTGDAVEIFPEGGRSPDGRVYRFQRGFAQLARVTGAPVAPVALLGADLAWPADRTLPRPARIEVRFGPVLPAPEDAGLSPAEARALDSRFAARVRDAVLSLTDGRLIPTERSLVGGDDDQPATAT